MTGVLTSGQCQAVWDDLAYFPVADCKDEDLSVTFENSWMFERSYNGDRVHEGQISCRL